MRLSFEVADRLYWFAQMAGVFGAGCVTLSVAAMYWLTPVRQAHWVEHGRAAEHAIAAVQVPTPPPAIRQTIPSDPPAAPRPVPEPEPATFVSSREPIQAASSPPQQQATTARARHLSQDQRSGLIEGIGNYGPQILVRVQRAQVDKEARDFADEIIDALGHADVNFDVNNYGAIDPPLYGVALVRSGQSQASETLQHAFAEANIPLLMLDQPGLDRLQLIVGQNLRR